MAVRSLPSQLEKFLRGTEKCMFVVSPVDDCELPPDHKLLMTVRYHPYAIQ